MNVLKQFNYFSLFHFIFIYSILIVLFFLLSFYLIALVLLSFRVIFCLFFFSFFFFFSGVRHAVLFYSLFSFFPFSCFLFLFFFCFILKFLFTFHVLICTKLALHAQCSVFFVCVFVFITFLLHFFCIIINHFEN